MTPDKPEIEEIYEDNSDDNLAVSPEPVSVGNMVDSRSNIRLHLHRQNSNDGLSIQQSMSSVSLQGSFRLDELTTGQLQLNTLEDKKKKNTASAGKKYS